MGKQPGSCTDTAGPGRSVLTWALRPPLPVPSLRTEEPTPAGEECSLLPSLPHPYSADGRTEEEPLQERVSGHQGRKTTHTLHALKSKCQLDMGGPPNHTQLLWHSPF